MNDLMNMTGPTPTHQQIAEHAYCIWQGEGCPEGRALDHWCDAETAEQVCRRQKPPQQQTKSVKP